ncbi:MAG TPA: sigma-70 family RNA polymerase sigma factor [Terriglobales bacterium]|jgi:RNA polymerase sigma factor (sigma-70 family)
MQEEVAPFEVLEGAALNDDHKLVQDCIAGDQEAWTALIAKYKRLIYSIPFRYGATPDDAADIFQAVCLEMFCELQNLRKIESLRSWIITVTIHKSLRWKKRNRNGDLELDAMESDQVEEVSPATVPPDMLQLFQEEQMIREAIAELPKRCVEMVRMLFYEVPPVAYAEVAQRLGLATGSIGFIRGRCLNKLQKLLAAKGL